MPPRNPLMSPKGSPRRPPCTWHTSSRDIWQWRFLIDLILLIITTKAISMKPETFCKLIKRWHFELQTPMSVSCKDVNNLPFLPAIGMFIQWPDSVNVHNLSSMLHSYVYTFHVYSRVWCLNKMIPSYPALQDPTSPSTVSSPSSSRLVSQIIGAEDDYFDSDQEQVSHRLDVQKTRLSWPG